MDFLEIRKKAKERAAARAAASQAVGAAHAAPGPPAGATPPPVTPSPPVPAHDLDRTPAVGDPAAFTTWRPGEGAPPVPLGDLVVPAAALAPGAIAPGFAVLRPAAGGPGSESAPPLTPTPALTTQAPVPPPVPKPTASPLDEFFYRPDEEAPELPDLGGAAASDLDAGAEAAALEEYLTFLLGAEEYAVAIERVREVLKAPPITEVPRAPAGILGVVTVRGEVVAVVDPRPRLGLPPGPDAAGAARIILVDAGEGTCGLLVDRVASVVRLRPGSIEPCPQGIGGTRADCLAGIGRERDRLFTVLHLAALLRRAPAEGAPGAGRRDAVA